MVLGLTLVEMSSVVSVKGIVVISYRDSVCRGCSIISVQGSSGMSVVTLCTEKWNTTDGFAYVS